MSERIEQNKRRARMLIGSLAIVIFVILAVVNLLVRGGIIGFAVAFVLAVGGAFVAYWQSDSVALSMSGARPADPDRHPRLHNLVEGLCISAGLFEARIHVIDDEAPNAFVVARDPEHSAVVVTTGLLEKMNRVELEGVLAHELHHVKNHDALVSTVAVTVVGIWIFPPFASFAARLMQRVVPPNREELADLSGVRTTRYPPGLIEALEKIRSDQTSIRSSKKAIAHLWFAPPAPDDATGSGVVDRFDTHPLLEERIERLREL